MSELDVRVIRLEPMRVASVQAFGASPEADAWEKLMAWAGSRGLFDGPEQHRIFGFNNPDPSPGSPNYGYEFWITVDASVESGGEATVKEFSGGLYAVTRCEGVDAIGPSWKQLGIWREDSKYRDGTHQWLEEHIGPPVGTLQDMDELLMDFYYPIR